MIQLLETIKSEQEQGKTISVEEQSDLTLLKEVAEDRIDLEKRVQDLEKMKVSDENHQRIHNTQAELNEAMARARKYTKKPEPAPKRRNQPLDVVDCFGCGQPIPVWKFAGHTLICYSKVLFVEASITHLL